MEYYPVHLQLQGKKTVMIGGGKIAERKTAGLLSAGAEVTVISPDLTERMQSFLQEGKMKWKKKRFSPEDIHDAFLIIAAANDPDVNLAVKKAASGNQLLSLCDNPEESNFILPSVIRQGRLTITISTSGASPMLAKKIKTEISAQYGSEYKDYVDFLFKTRKWILEEIKEPGLKRQLLSAITEEDFLHSSNREKDFADLMIQWRNEI
ncbi:precorrin-2 dehydrogenase/sirohydrochlorin ferrochelatase family protein [Bacillus benzoevorans]|uniref:precorrin-2 dehydrogenase n=1 Tax=Bacillus benzoevorans TaxID=1456 RepID=A0A7X0HXC9_9BACI|nr:NAD(P)-dependent oxidoreductase [Bacillus benzoevorans]MBB6447335.1 precorrin-2 dehydrogenase/sirohydrochlorin ferrochelatase [Bacillus benzoevorans]